MKGVFTTTGVKGMLDRKDYAVACTVLPLIAAFLNREIGCGDSLAKVIGHMLCSDIVNQLLHIKLESKTQRIGEVVTNENIQQLKMLANNLFKELE